MTKVLDWNNKKLRFILQWKKIEVQAFDWYIISYSTNNDLRANDMLLYNEKIDGRWTNYLIEIFENVGLLKQKKIEVHVLDWKMVQSWCANSAITPSYFI